VSDRKSLGEILVDAGRVSRQQVGQALEYQKAHGGRFGEALVALGAITHEEVEWGLAQQFDLPFVFPDPSAVDPDAAALVSAEWALANLAIPIMRAGNVLTVVVDAPVRSRAAETLAESTGLEVQLALASPARIRDLIRQVYGRGGSPEEQQRLPRPVPLGDALDAALQCQSRRFGISVRGRRGWFWHDDQGTIRRALLEAHWEAALDDALDPPPGAVLGGKPAAAFSGLLVRGGVGTRVDVRCLVGGGGREYLIRPVEEDGFLLRRFSPPPESVSEEVRLLARTGSARFLVSATPDELARDILPHLPSLLFEASWRSVHVHRGEGGETGEAFSVRLSPQPSRWAHELGELRVFHFDVVTVDLAGPVAEWMSAALDLAAVTFILWPRDRDVSPAREAGIRWRLSAVRDEEDHVAWSLDPLED